MSGRLRHCLLTAGWLAGAVPAFAQSGAATLTVRIERLSPKGGILRLGLYDAANYPGDTHPAASADLPVSGEAMSVTLRGLVPGTYAIECYQDINANDRMDSSWLGLPEEPYGFSRDAKPFLSKPGFGAVSFTLMPGENSQILHLQNSPRP